MRLLLLDPNIEGRAGEPPLNLALLKAYVNQRTSHRARIVDFTFRKRDWRRHLLDSLARNPVDLVGISMMSFNYAQALEVAGFIKGHMSVPIIFGGVHAILMPGEVIRNSQADMVCVGEGEYVLADLLEAGLNPAGIKGLWYKTAGGKIVRNDRQPFIPNLDDLPFPDWDDFDLTSYFKVNIHHLPMMCSRGCPYECTYCSASALKKALGWTKVRRRSVDSVMTEIARLDDRYAAAGFRHIQFNDDTFILDKRFVLDFCRAYRERGFHRRILWAANVRADLVTEEVIAAMREAGCYELGLGVESVDDFIRNRVYKRNMTVDEIRRAAAAIKKNGIQLHIPIILGSPYDTVEIMERNLAFAKELDAECLIFPVLMPLPGTEIRDVCRREGLIEKERFEGAHVMHTRPVIRTKYASRRQVARMIRKIRLSMMAKYALEGLRRKGVVFLRDLLVFLVRDKPRFRLEIDNAWKFTIGKYNLEKYEREWNVLPYGPP